MVPLYKVQCYMVCTICIYGTNSTRELFNKTSSSYINVNCNYIRMTLIH